MLQINVSCSAQSLEHRWSKVWDELASWVGVFKWSLISPSHYAHQHQLEGLAEIYVWSNGVGKPLATYGVWGVNYRRSLEWYISRVGWRRRHGSF